jgi:hypothetical protein
MNKIYLAVEFLSGRNTTTGTANPLTGRMSKACDLMVFSDKAERDNWVSNGKVTSDMGGNCRESVSKSAARKLKLGWSIAEFNEHLDMMLDAHKL